MSDSFINRLETMEIDESVDYVGIKTDRLNELLKSLEPRQFSVSVVKTRHKITRVE